jgi:hypothetical protein
LVAARIGLQYEIRGWPEGAANHLNGQPGFMPELEIPYAWLQGPPRPGPMFTASFWPSLGAFFSASVAVNAALRVRGLTGRGQWVETSLLQGAMAGAWANWLRAENIGRDSGMNSWIWCSRAPQGHYQCADGKWIHNWLPNYRFLLGAANGEDPKTLDPKTDPDRISGAMEDLVIMAGAQEEVISHRRGRGPSSRFLGERRRAGQHPRASLSPGGRGAQRPVDAEGRLCCRAE